MQVVSWHAEDEAVDATGGDSDDSDDLQGGEYHGYRGYQSPFQIRAFGVLHDGRSAAVLLKGFTPFFYVRVPDDVSIKGKRALEAVRAQLEEECKKVVKTGAGGFHSAHTMQRVDYWGFQNGTKAAFVRVAFKSHAAMRAVARNLGSRPVRVGGLGDVKFSLYESNIDPLLRMFHIQDLSPAGWVHLERRCMKSLGDCRKTLCQLNVCCDWRDLHPLHSRNDMAPMMLAGFDIECNSAHGDFPQASKDYRKLAIELEQVWERQSLKGEGEYTAKTYLGACLRAAMQVKPSTGADANGQLPDPSTFMPKLQFKGSRRPGPALLGRVVDDVYTVLSGKSRDKKKAKQQHAVDAARAVEQGDGQQGDSGLNGELAALLDVLNAAFNTQYPLHGDEIIQIGTTVSFFGQPGCCGRYIFVLGTCTDGLSCGTSADAAPIIVRSFDNEAALLEAWLGFVQELDPDVLLGYNLFGFDMAYLVERATELMGQHACRTRFLRFGRIDGLESDFREQRLASSALGDNMLRYINMQGRVVVDLMKIVQRDHRLDSYRLDAVAEHFLGLRKHDVTPQDVFRLQRGTAGDRRIIAEYCIQDCELCNKLAAKLQLLANNMGMANVCSVPLAYIFMRGQGVKILSLVAKQCRNDGMLIPARQKSFGPGAGEDGEEAEGYEGAIVLEPQTGMYLNDPVSVLDYNSLYPSSMISHNISHDSLVLDMQRYGNLPGVDYLDVSFDVYDGKGDKRTCSGRCVCRFAQGTGGVREPAVLPRILQRLIQARKATRRCMAHVKVTLSSSGAVLTGEIAPGGSGGQPHLVEYHGTVPTGQTVPLNEQEAASAVPAHSSFEKAVLDGLQLAYKVTANSLYGQMGARTSALYLKEVAACTTAVGREMIMQAKEFVESPEVGGRVVYGDSVADYTPVLVRLHGGAPFYDTVDRLHQHGGGPWTACLDAGRELKEACELPGMETWTDMGWVKLQRVIRHRLAPHKRIVRVQTLAGVVDVTDDHSLLRPDGSMVSSKELQVGDPLLHASLPWAGISAAADDAAADTTQYIEAQVLGMYVACTSGMEVANTPWPWAIIATSDVLCAYQQLCRTAYPEMDWVITDAPGPQPGGAAACALVPMSHAGGASDNAFATRFMQHFGGSSSSSSSSSSSKPAEHACHVPAWVLSAGNRTRHAFWQGMCDAPGGLAAFLSRCTQLAAATVFALAKGLGYNVCMATSAASRPGGYRMDITLGRQHHSYSFTGVTHMQHVTYSSGRYVYDLTTDNQHFAAGVGQLVVHNTDSIFVVFKNVDPGTGQPLQHRGALASSITQAQNASRMIAPQLRPPHNLEYEKTMFPLILLSKKRYVGLLYEDDPDATPVQKSMGVALKRRDYAPIVKKVYGGVLDILLRHRDVPRAVDFLKSSLVDLAEGRYQLSDLVISKTLRSTYKNPQQIAHWVLARRMFERDPGSAPQANDRVPYVFVETDKANALMSDRIEHVDWVAKNKLRIDTKTYIEHQVAKPCLQLLSIALEQLPGYVHNDSLSGPSALAVLLDSKGGDMRKARERLDALREREVERMLFNPILTKHVAFRQRDNRCSRQHELPAAWRMAGLATQTQPSRASAPASAANLPKGPVSGDWRGVMSQLGSPAAGGAQEKHTCRKAGPAGQGKLRQQTLQGCMKRPRAQRTAADWDEVATQTLQLINNSS